MCTVPAAYDGLLALRGSCALLPSEDGWNAARDDGGVPPLGGTSVLLARSAVDPVWRAVFFTSSDVSLHDRWFTQHGQTMAHRFCWDQIAQAAAAWCCLHAQVTALAGAPPMPPPLGPCLLAHGPGQHPAGNWEFRIRWWAAPAPLPPRSANARTRAFQSANQDHLAARWGLPGFGLLAPARLAERLANIGPCGCP